VQSNGAADAITLRIRDVGLVRRLSARAAGVDRTVNLESDVEQSIDIPIDARTGAVALQLTTGTCDGEVPGHLTLTVE
jgi:hypothetical protein